MQPQLFYPRWGTLCHHGQDDSYDSYPGGLYDDVYDDLNDNFDDYNDYDDYDDPYDLYDPDDLYDPGDN